MLNEQANKLLEEIRKALVIERDTHAIHDDLTPESALYRSGFQAAIQNVMADVELVADMIRKQAARERKEAMCE